MGRPNLAPIGFLEGGDERELQEVAGEACFAPDLEVFAGACVGCDEGDLEHVFAAVGFFLGNGCADFDSGPAPGFFCAVVLCARTARKHCRERTEFAGCAYGSLENSLSAIFGGFDACEFRAYAECGRPAGNIECEPSRYAIGLQGREEPCAC